MKSSVSCCFETNRECGDVSEYSLILGFECDLSVCQGQWTLNWELKTLKLDTDGLRLRYNENKESN